MTVTDTTAPAPSGPPATAAAALEPLRARLRRGGRRGAHATWVLLRVSVPTFVIIDLLRQAGAIARVGAWCAPAMALFRLPGEAAVPVMIGAFLNVYSATAALGTLALSGAQITTLGFMIGMAHSLVLETIILRAARAPALRLLLLRLALSAAAGLVASRLLIRGGA